MNRYARQLHLGVPNRDVNIKSRYVRGMNKYQVQLGTEDWSLDFYNDTQALENMSNMDGWNDSTEIHGDDYSNIGGYPILLGGEKKECKNTCRNVKGLKWKKGGKDCYKSCIEGTGAINPNAGASTPPTSTDGSGAGASGSQGGGNTGMVIGIVAGLAVLGTVTFLILRKK